MQFTGKFQAKIYVRFDLGPITPMTYSTAMYFLGYDPYTGEKVFSAKSRGEKEKQKSCFFHS